jgi:hypothetical protein
VVEARRLARKSPKTGKRRSLRSIAAELAALGHLGPSGLPYHAGSVRYMMVRSTAPFTMSPTGTPCSMISSSERGKMAKSCWSIARAMGFSGSRPLHSSQSLNLPNLFYRKGLLPFIGTPEECAPRRYRRGLWPMSRLRWCPTSSRGEEAKPIRPNRPSPRSLNLAASAPLPAGTVGTPSRSRGCWPSSSIGLTTHREQSEAASLGVQRLRPQQMRSQTWSAAGIWDARRAPRTPSRATTRSDPTHLAHG